LNEKSLKIQKVVVIFGDKKPHPFDGQIWLRRKDMGVNDLILIFGVLMPLSAIFQLYHGDQF
jgi:hypothetical protein